MHRLQRSRQRRCQELRVQVITRVLSITPCVNCADCDSGRRVFVLKSVRALRSGVAGCREITGRAAGEENDHPPWLHSSREEGGRRQSTEGSERRGGVSCCTPAPLLCLCRPCLACLCHVISCRRKSEKRRKRLKPAASSANSATAS